jgi:ubiquitin-protein ligase
VLVISDGEDTGSTETLAGVRKALGIPRARRAADPIIVDAIFIGQEATGGELARLCHETGGYAFCPGTIEEGLTILEQEAFLFAKERIGARVRSTEDWDTVEDLKNRSIAEANQLPNLKDVKVFIYNNLNKCSNNFRENRILRELHVAAVCIDAASPKPFFDPNVMVFCSGLRFDRWRCYLKAPDDSKYGGMWWYIYVTFPEAYPIRPPVFRFVSVPYHLNIASDGRVCLDCIERRYTSSSQVMTLLSQIRMLFDSVDLSSPVHLEKMRLYQYERDEYFRLARASCANAKRHWREWVPEHCVDVLDKPFSVVVDRRNLPGYMQDEYIPESIPVTDGQGPVVAYLPNTDFRELMLSRDPSKTEDAKKELGMHPEDLDDMKWG